MNVRRFKAYPVALAAVVLLAPCFAARARQPAAAPSRPAAEEARVARLVGLARVWGTVKYFHPALAYRELDWDKALVEAIPKVRAAKTPQEYTAALNRMLAALGDESTRAEVETEARPAPPAQATTPSARTAVPAREHVRAENGVLFIDAMQVAEAGARDNTACRVTLGKIGETIPAARAVVIDARAPGEPAEFAGYIFADMLRQVLPQLLDADLTLGSGRHRMHNGYATQTGGASFYYSAFANVAPQTLAGRNKAKTPPVVFVVNEHTPPAIELLGGLQHAGRAFVIQEGERAPEAGGRSFTLELPFETATDAGRRRRAPTAT